MYDKGATATVHKPLIFPTLTGKNDGEYMSGQAITEPLIVIEKLFGLAYLKARKRRQFLLEGWSP